MRWSPWVLGIVVLAAGLAGCGQHNSEDDTAQIRATIEQILTEADDKGIDSEARATLVAAMDAGRPISFEEVKQAQYTAIDCVKSVGFDVKTFDSPNAPGGIAYMFGIQGREGDLPKEMDDKAHACEERGVLWVEAAYQRTHAPPIASMAARFEPYRASFVQCLEDRGATVESTLTAEALLELGADPRYAEGYDLPCVAVVGFDATQ